MKANRIHYLDHASTSPLLPSVAEVITACHQNNWANPSSLHAAGARAKQALDDARAFIRGSLGAQRLVFTAGATEANNLAIRSAAGSQPGQLLALATEHASVLEPLKEMSRAGHRVDLIPVDRLGLVNLGHLAQALNPETRLLCILHGNNETGTLQPLAEIIKLVRQKAPQTLIHLDAVQSYGRLRLDLDDHRIDSLAISSHKLGGPSGCGALALSSRSKLKPLITGGGQEDGLRGGTENLAAIVGLARAAESTLGRSHEEWTRVENLKTELAKGLLAAIPNCHINGPDTGGLPHILNMSFPEIPGEVLLHHLAADGIMVGTGSACSGTTKGPSHVLSAMEIPDKDARSSLRFSFGHSSQPIDVTKTLEILPPLVARLRKLGVR